LGSGGLGRLAACFIDSLATLEIPSLGYGIRYEFGIFQQQIVDGWQIEKTDKWLRFGNPWELARPEWAVSVKFGGTTEHYVDDQERPRVRWVPHKIVHGVPYDTLILGYRTNTANTLRLWSAEAPESFDFAAFNSGDYYGAVNQKVTSENLSKVLYPNDEQLRGKELRLEQQYFFVSCSIQDMFRVVRTQEVPLEKFHEKFAVQLNDTHPAIAIAELMRLFIDEYALPWAEAWSVTAAPSPTPTTPCCPRRWSAGRSRCSAAFCRVICRSSTTSTRISSRRCACASWAMRIASAACRSSTRAISATCAWRIWPASAATRSTAWRPCTPSSGSATCSRTSTSSGRRNSATRPTASRRAAGWCCPIRCSRSSSPSTSATAGSRIWPSSRLEPLAEDAAFRARWRDIKQQNKRSLAALALERTGIRIDPDSMYDVLVKRIHEYKRQHLKVLHIVSLYHGLKSNPGLALVPRTFIFGGKAAPGYHLAKLMIKLITSVGDVINRDPDMRDRLKLVFLPNFNVTNGQHVYPAADLSEQISTAGKEASGTGNMKFCMNGALTIGTLDGANIELREEIGAENFFLFGYPSRRCRAQVAGYRPMDYYAANQHLREVIDLIRSGFFTRGDTRCCSR
jgi:starch phosphorylase